MLLDFLFNLMETNGKLKFISETFQDQLQVIFVNYYRFRLLQLLQGQL